MARLGQTSANHRDLVWLHRLREQSMRNPDPTGLQSAASFRPAASIYRIYEATFRPFGAQLSLQTYGGEAFKRFRSSVFGSRVGRATPQICNRGVELDFSCSMLLKPKDPYPLNFYIFTKIPLATLTHLYPLSLPSVTSLSSSRLGCRALACGGQ